MSGNGIDRGLTTGEPFGQFVFWVVTRYPEGKFTDESVQAIIRSEFPDRRLAHGGRGTYQKISQQRSYARRNRDRLSIYSDAEAAEVLARIDGKMGMTQEA